MMKKLFLIIVKILLVGSGFCQNTKMLIGAVKTETNLPIEGVNVSILGVGFDITTTSGEFRIALPEGLKVGDKITINLIKDNWEPVSLKEQEVIIPANLILNPIILQMREIIAYQKSQKIESKFQNIELIESYQLVGGKIVMDITALNTSDKPIILNKIILKSTSPVAFECLSGFGDGIEVAANYRIDFGVSKGKTQIMDPPLIVKSNDAVRFIVELTPHYTGACSHHVPFEIMLELYSGKNLVAQTDKYNFDSHELETSEYMSLELLRNKVKADDKDVYTMRRLIDALGCCIHEEERVDLWKKIIKVAPNDLDAHINLAARIDDKFPEEIIYYFEAAIKLDSTVKNMIGYNVMDAYENIVRKQIEKLNYNEALNLILHIKKMGLKIPDIYRLQAEIYAKKEMFNCEKALESLKIYCNLEEEYLKKQNMYKEGRIYRDLEYELKNALKTLNDCDDITKFLKELQVNQK